ncbi:MAG: PHP domain-containing protein [Thaumarchaeota archaeon]|nr:PHP domain-containing protein [Nitrososphaerota archaeon]
MHADNHSHIILEQIESMVAAARKKVVNRLSITEHISQFSFFREKVIFASTHETGRMFSSFEEYIAEFAKVSKDKAVAVRKGLEVDYIDEYSREIGALVSKRDWDFLLCSVHEFRGIDVEKYGLPQDQKSSAERWVEYFETQKKAIQSDFVPFAVVTHPVRLGVSTPVYPENIQEMLANLASLARDRGKALELNGKDLESYPHLVRKVAQACSDTKCKVSYGSDSHRAGEVSRQYELASKLIREFELKVV